MEFRTPQDSDWPEILRIANRSVAVVPGAVDQSGWLATRRHVHQDEDQYHVVLEDKGRILGYGAVEHADEAASDSYRIFVVTDPEHLEEYGSLIFEHAELRLQDFKASSSYFMEYADDERLNSFIRRRGYSNVMMFDLDSGRQAVILSKSLLESDE